MEHEKGGKLTKYDQSVKIMVWPFAFRVCCDCIFFGIRSSQSYGFIVSLRYNTHALCGHASLNVIKVMRNIEIDMTTEV